MFNRAVATFSAPSNPCNIDGMCNEVIWAAPSWLKGMPHYDCVFINSNNDLHSMHRMEVAQAICFFSFTHLDITYACVLVHWFSHITEELDESTGMWMVTPDFDDEGSPNLTVIHIDCIFCAAHLIPIFRDSFVPDHITLDNSLDYFKGFYINHFVDHHAFSIAS